MDRVRGISRKAVAAAAIGATVLLFAAVAGARSTTVDNLGFESGDLSLWSVSNTASAAGSCSRA